ncbi:hypothetical protein pb186bvf_012256 [Paramecium bursaria]
MNVFGVMNIIATSGEISQGSIEKLMICFNADVDVFLKQLEQCYLKIIDQRNNISQNEKRLFENLLEKITKALVDQMHEQAPILNTRNQSNLEIGKKAIQHFIQLFCIGLKSILFMVKVQCARFLLMIVRNISQDDLNHIANDNIAYELLNLCVSLFRNNKVIKTGKTLKGLAIKLASYLQYINYNDRKTLRVRQAIQALKSEQLKCLCEDEDKQIRLDSIINIELNDFSLKYLIPRLRDDHEVVGYFLLKKIFRHQFQIFNIPYAEMCQLLFDGLNTLFKTDEREQTKQIIIQCFNMLSDDPTKKTNYDKLLNSLQFDRVLIFPYLYKTFRRVVEIVIETIDPQLTKLYFVNLMNQFPKISQYQLTFLRIMGELFKQNRLQDPLESAVDVRFPAAGLLCEGFQSSSTLLERFELLQIVLLNHKIKGPDYERILHFLHLAAEGWGQVKAPLPENYFSDVYHQMTEQQLNALWFSQRPNQPWIIKDQFDLVQPAFQALYQQANDQQSFLFEFTVRNIMNNLEQTKKDYDQDQLQIRLTSLDNQLRGLTLDIDKLNKVKQNSDHLKQIKNSFQAEFDMIMDKIQDFTKAQQNIDILSFYQIDAFVRTTKIRNYDEQQLKRIRALIIQLSSKYNSEELVCFTAKYMALRCLGYIAIFGLQFQGAILSYLVKQLFNENPRDQIDNPAVVCITRTMFDSLLLFRKLPSLVISGNYLRTEQINDLIINYVLKSQGIVQCLFIEGICKLLVHNKLPEPQKWLAILLFLWHNDSIVKTQKQLYILNRFLRLYVASNPFHLVHFEQGCEIYFAICSYMLAEKYLFNNGILNNNSTTNFGLLKVARVSAKVLSYKDNLQSIIQMKRKMEDTFIGPQELLIIFVSKVMTSYGALWLRGILNCLIRNCDFLKCYDSVGDENNPKKIKIKPYLLQVLAIYTKELIERLEKLNQDTKYEDQFLKLIQNLVGTEPSQEAKQQITLIENSVKMTQNISNNLVQFMKVHSIIAREDEGDMEGDIEYTEKKQEIPRKRHKQINK